MIMLNPNNFGVAASSFILYKLGKYVIMSVLDQTRNKASRTQARLWKMMVQSTSNDNQETNGEDV